MAGWLGSWSGGWFGTIVEPVSTANATGYEARAREAMTAHWLSLWSSTPTAIDGEVFAALELWTRFSILHSTRRQSTVGLVGNRRFVSSGNIAVQVFGEIGRGAAQVSALADEIRTTIEARDIAIAGSDDPVCIGAGATRPLVTEGAWLMHLVVAKFEYTELR